MQISRKSFIYSLLSGSTALLLTQCGPTESDSIKVGEICSLTGKEATFGQSSHEGTLLAIEEINKAGGVFGKPLQLLSEDTQSKAGETTNAINKLISKDQVVAVLGEVTSSRSLEAAPTAQRAQIPMITPAATNPDVTLVGDYIFRVCFIDPFQGTVMAKFAMEKLQAKRLSVLTDVKSDYSKGLAKYFKEAVASANQEIVSELDFNGGDKDFKAQLTAIKASNPDAIFVPAYYNDVALILVQAKQLGIDVPILGGDGWESPALLEIAKDAAENHYFSTHYSHDSDSPKTQTFISAYKERFNGKVPDCMAALGYDSVFFLVEAMKKAGTTEASALRDALAATRQFEGVTGSMAMSENRDAVKPAVILQIKDGKFNYLETIHPENP